MECCICLETTNEVFKCSYCTSTAAKYCYKCLIRYLSENVESMGCVICKVRFSATDFKTLPLKYKKLIDKTLNNYNKKLTEQLLISSRYLIPKVKNRLKTIDKINECTNKIDKLNKLLLKKEAKRDKLEKRKNIELTDICTYKEDMFTFVCPNSSCSGSIDIKASICNLCRADVCSQCIEIIKEDEIHECKKATLDTIKELLNSSRPCPNCKTLINKLEGCSTMYCVECKTPFNWITGEVIKGSFHNPHTKENKDTHFTVDYSFLNTEFFREINEKEFPGDIHHFIGYYYALNISTNILREKYAMKEGFQRYKAVLTLLNISTVKELEAINVDIFNELQGIRYILSEFSYIKNTLEMLFNIIKEAPKSSFLDIISTFFFELRKHEKNLSPYQRYMSSINIPITMIMVNI